MRAAAILLQLGDDDLIVAITFAAVAMLCVVTSSSSLAARAVLDKRKNELKTQRAREMGSSIREAAAAAAAASMTQSPPVKSSVRTPRLPASQLPRGGGAIVRKPPPAAPLDAGKTKLPFDPAPPPKAPKAEEPPPPPPPAMRMAKERIGPVPLAERLHPGDVDFGKVSCMLVVEVVALHQSFANEWRRLRQRVPCDAANHDILVSLPLILCECVTPAPISFLCSTLFSCL